MNKLFLLSLFGVTLLLSACQRQEEEPAPPTAVPISATDTAVPLLTITPSPTASEATVAPQPTKTSPPPPKSSPTPPPTPTAAPTAVSAAAPSPQSLNPSSPPPPGALIAVSIESSVGVLLDEFPEEMRDRVAEAIIAQPEDVWLARTQRQLRLTKNRLNFRNFVYEDKGQLPLPPPELWDIQLDTAGPRRETVQGHDLVLLDYSFTSALLTDPESIAQAEPVLAKEGAVWQEFFAFPADPDMLLQRTDNACVNEAGFPPNSFDSENVWHFYNFECTADSGGALGCHRTQLATFDCREALSLFVGVIETDVRWERLLQFDATVHNVGGAALHIGPAKAEDPENNVFDYNACHDHLHYSNYGEFFLANQAELTGSKQAFCVQSTTRPGNNEWSPLTHPYSCTFQGVQAGWADEYVAGLDAQWVDITDLDVPPDGRTVGLGFTSNGDKFMCEGTLITDENGEVVWEPSGFVTEEGESINRPQCDFIENWDVNNEDVRDVFVPQTGSFVTAACANDESGPKRNCGFTELELTANDRFCEPGENVDLSVALSQQAAPQVLRVCEWSAALGTGVACVFEDALLNRTIVADTAVSFACPSIRDAAADAEITGGFAVYAAPLWPEDGGQLLVSGNQ
ncbi:MAG: hypothetical protein HF973_16330 [Chloroflexi bacterium]|nr:hypothetical protein [Chloroflexota bacterium]